MSGLGEDLQTTTGANGGNSIQLAKAQTSLIYPDNHGVVRYHSIRFFL